MSAPQVLAPSAAVAQGGPPKLGRASTRTYASTIPTIDMALDDVSISEDLRSAFIQFGFATITHHGVDEGLVEAVFAQNRAFFDLPLEEKLKIKADENYRGYTPLQEETLDPAASRSPDSKEGLYFGRHVPADAPEALTTPLTGPNQWPSEELLPGYRAATEAYLAAMTALGRRLVRLIARALRLPPGFFDAAFERPLCFLRPLHYTGEASDAAGGRFAAGAHTDYGMLTILRTGDVGGLQIQLNGTWVDVDPPKGSFVINIGDMLERWSNSLFRSTLHRVLTHGAARYSLPFFFEPNFHTRVACLPTCCSPDNPPRWPTTTSGQHLLDKYAATHSGYSAKPLPSDP